MTLYKINCINSVGKVCLLKKKYIEFWNSVSVFHCMLNLAWLLGIFKHALDHSWNLPVHVLAMWINFFVQRSIKTGPNGAWT